MSATTTERLNQRIDETGTMLCVGLDPSLETLQHLGMESRVFELNCAIIDAVAHTACAFKPQFAHYAALGLESELQATCDYIKQCHPTIPILLDVKRGDIGSTAEQYAKEAYQRYAADGVTLNLYMGSDTLLPFLAYPEKAAIVLIKTSNPSAAELQDLRLQSGLCVYQHLAQQLVQCHSQSALWFVVGATQIEAVQWLRQQCPEVTFLVPGVGAQGGDPALVVKYGLTEASYGLAINVSRGITALQPTVKKLADYLTDVHEKAEFWSKTLQQLRKENL